AAFAQLHIDWYTIDSGGGTSYSGAFSLTGTIGQHDAGGAAAGTFACIGGFWAAHAAASPCYANCDGSTASPVLNVNDFICFQAAFAAGAPYANCDQSTAPPLLNVNDFICFQSTFAAGCP